MMQSTRHLPGLNAIVKHQAQVVKRASPGERVMGSLFPSRYGGAFGSWWSDRIQQVAHFRDWQYIAIDLLANKRASIKPNIAWSTDRPIKGSTVKASQRSLMNAVGSGLGGEPFVGGQLTKSSSRENPKSSTVYGNYVGMTGYDPDGVAPVGFSGGGHSFLTLGEWRSKALSVVEAHENLMPMEQDHPLPRLMANPNPVDTAFDIAYELYMYWGLTGVAYEWTPKNRFGVPCERWCIPSHWVYPRTGAGQYVPFNHEHADELIWDYEIRPWGYPGYAGVLHFPPDEVITYKSKHPLSKIDGWSKLAAGAQVIDLSEATTQTQWSQMINQAVPGMIVKLGPGYEDMDEDEIARVEAKFFQRVQGSFNYGKPVFAPSGSEVMPYGYNPTEMAYQSGQEQARDRVLALWNMPKAALGLTENMTYGSVMAVLGGLCVWQINPGLTAMGQTLTKHLASQFDERSPAFSTMSGGGYGSGRSARRAKMFFDDCVPADPQQVNSDLQLDITANAVTPNEIRALRGRQPYRRGGDNPIVNGPGGPMPLVINAKEDVDDMAAIMAQITEAQGSETGQQQSEDVDTTAQARVDAVEARETGDQSEGDHGATGLEPPETTNNEPSKTVTKTVVLQWRTTRSGSWKVARFNTQAEAQAFIDSYRYRRDVDFQARIAPLSMQKSVNGRKQWDTNDDGGESHFEEPEPPGKVVDKSPQTVQQSVEELKRLWESCTQPSTTYATIEQAVGRIAAAHGLDELKEIARGFGLNSVPSGKAAIAQRIVARISERKGRMERGDEISRVAQGGRPKNLMRR